MHLAGAGPLGRASAGAGGRGQEGGGTHVVEVAGDDDGADVDGGPYEGDLDCVLSRAEWM